MRRAVATKWALGLGGVVLAVAVPATVAMAGTSANGAGRVQSGYSTGYGVMAEDCPPGLGPAERDQLRDQVRDRLSDQNGQLTRDQVREQVHEQMQLLIQQRAAS